MENISVAKKSRHISTKKSLVALNRRRVNGRFVSDDPEAAERKKQEKDASRIKDNGFNETDVISPEDHAYFGKDSKKFFEIALEKAPTWYEALKYAKELKPIQHPALQSIQAKTETIITKKILRCEWFDDSQLINISDNKNSTIEQKVKIESVIEQSKIDGTDNSIELQTEQDTNGSPQELKTV